MEEPGYVAAVADGLVFALGDAWERLSAHDRKIGLDRVKAELAHLADLDVRIDFGDGEVPVIPDSGAKAIAGLRDQLARIRAAAPQALAAGEHTFARILCTDPWPRIYTTAVLQWPASTPVHVVHASDLRSVPEQWAKVPELAKLTELRLLRMFGAPLDREPWPLALAGFRELQALDLSSSRLRALPPDVANATSLQALELGDNPIDASSLDALASLSSLRYVGLTGTGITASAVATLRARLPAGCKLELS